MMMMSSNSRLGLFVMGLLMVSSVASATNIVVDFKDDVSVQEIEALEVELGIDVKPNSMLFSRTKITNMSIEAGLVNSILEKLEDSDLVEGAEEEHIFKINPYVNSDKPGMCYVWEEMDYRDYQSAPSYGTSSPNDPMYDKQWNMRQIDVEKAWKTTEGDKVIVAVLDTGVSTGDGKYQRVPDLEQTCMVPGYNFVDNNSDAYDWHGHGTHVSGTIAQSTNNGIGVVGVAPKACIMPVKVLSDEGFGSDADIAEAIIWATDNGAKVINMSLGGGGYSKVMDKALDYAVKNNVFVACAAGNNGTPRIEQPAALSGCFAVSSVGKSGELAFYSSHGNNGGGLFIAAPGGDQQADGQEGGIWQDTIVSGRPNEHGYFPFQGTSMATPHVAGVAALVVAALQGTDYVLDDVAKAMSSSATEKDDKKKYGSGLLNAAGAVEAAVSQRNEVSFGGGAKAVLLAMLSLLTIAHSSWHISKLFGKNS